MKLPSLDYLASRVATTAQRFPLVLACAITAAIAAMTGLEEPSQENWRVAAAATLGLPLFTGVVLFAERRGLRPLAAWTLYAVGLAGLALFYWLWPTWGESGGALNFFHLHVTFLLAVAFLPYLGFAETAGFWQFNRRLFFRFCLGGIYSGVLFVGLALAIAAVDNLFGVDVDDLTYPRLWFLIALVFQSLFFLAGVPKNFDKLERSEEYPKGLRVFAQYLLLPLVGVYLVILTTYFGRVIFTTSWPSGWIGYLVSALAAVGVFSLLMTHPLRGKSEHVWLNMFERIFWIGALPSAIMLLLAVWQRIDQYGVTAPRYLLGALALWLTMVALYYVVTRSRKIRVIPLSLAVVGALSFVGPWSATAVSERSQVGRLQGILESHNLLLNGVIVPGQGEVSSDDWLQVQDILRYLIEWHGTSRIDSWFDGGVAAVDTIGAGTNPSVTDMHKRAGLITGYLGVVPTGGLMLDANGRVEITTLDGAEEALPIAGFNQVIPAADLFEGSFLLAGDTMELVASSDSMEVVLMRGEEELARGLLAGVIERAVEIGESERGGVMRLPAEAFWFDLDGDMVEGRVAIKSLELESRDGELHPIDARGMVLIRSLEGQGPA